MDVAFVEYITDAVMDLQGRESKLEDAKQKIELQIIQEEMKHPLLSREDVTQLEERRRLPDSFVNSVSIFDGYILITFNYKEGPEQVTFDEIKSSDSKSVGGAV